MEWHKKPGPCQSWVRKGATDFNNFYRKTHQSVRNFSRHERSPLCTLDMSLDDLTVYLVPLRLSRQQYVVFASLCNKFISVYVIAIIITIIIIAVFFLLFYILFCHQYCTDKLSYCRLMISF